jgi:protein-tyrosine phosphatase
MENRVLFVCRGNVYRSQIAEYLFKRMFPGFRASSAGIDKKHAGKTVRQVWKDTDLEHVGKDLKSVGVDILGNRCKLVTRKDVERAGKILVMEKEQKKFITKKFPKYADKVFLLGELARLKNPAILDLPVQPDAKKTAAKIKKALQVIKKKKLLNE